MVEGCFSPEDYWWNRALECLRSAKGAPRNPAVMPLGAAGSAD